MCVLRVVRGVCVWVMCCIWSDTHRRSSLPSVTDGILSCQNPKGNMHLCLKSNCMWQWKYFWNYYCNLVLEWVSQHYIISEYGYGFFRKSKYVACLLYWWESCVLERDALRHAGFLLQVKSQNGRNTRTLGVSRFVVMRLIYCSSLS